MCVERAHLLLLLLASGWRCVSGIRVFTAGDVKAVNGTDVRLKCTFQSSAAIRASSVTVSWSFRPLGPGHEETVFYYHERPFAPLEGRFRKKVDWAGDISGRDASVVLRRVPFSFNGTFSCQVKNPPDVHGNVGVVRLQVVSTASLSEILILCVAIGGVILLILLLVMIAASLRRCHRRRNPEPNHTVFRHEHNLISC
ncbi:myelin protein zero-like protein 2 [Sinocyclocheilus rhinocerous]|uniref:myelin protein zero-like protein 2 n=1 Tax=Sinocyclocheilus rhinocerous TaxID=307959 RepID=UPI0007BA9C50|nr:PREDICTED: myelin protein zero-like protein 2 [Sinocyclocheilus rhinocerous]